jgi:hypothetical protein
MKPAPSWRWQSFRMQLPQSKDDPHRLQAHAHHFADQPNDVLLIVRPVWVGADGAAFVLLDLVLSDDPFQAAAVADP